MLPNSIHPALHLRRTAEPSWFETTSGTHPQGARRPSIYGGQLLAQSVASATFELPEGSGLSLHSMHAYFLAGAVADLPLQFHVVPLRVGRTFAAYTVTAHQAGQQLLTLTASFKRPEPGGPSFLEPAPDVPPPEACTNRIETIKRRLSANPHWSDRMQTTAREYIQEYEDKILEVLDVPLDAETMPWSVGWWVRLRGVAPGELTPAGQKVALIYASDHEFMGAARKSMGIDDPFAGFAGAHRLGLTISLDHGVYFYGDDDGAVDLAADWVLIVQRPLLGGDGRATVQGRIFSRDGTPIALTVQEGVMRPRRPKPSKL